MRPSIGTYAIGNTRNRRADSHGLMCSRCRLFTLCKLPSGGVDAGLAHDPFCSTLKRALFPTSRSRRSPSSSRRSGATRARLWHVSAKAQGKRSSFGNYSSHRPLKTGRNASPITKFSQCPTESGQRSRAPALPHCPPLSWGSLSCSPEGSGRGSDIFVAFATV